MSLLKKKTLIWLLSFSFNTMSLRFSALVCEVPGGIRNLKTKLQKKEQKKKSQSVVLPVCTHLPAECTLWQGCCRRPGRLRCRQPPGSGTESRWSGLSANSSWSPGCWCSSPGSPPATRPDGTCGRTNTIQLLAWSLKILHSNKVLSTVCAKEKKILRSPLLSTIRCNVGGWKVRDEAHGKKSHLKYGGMAAE